MCPIEIAVKTSLVKISLLAVAIPVWLSLGLGISGLPCTQLSVRIPDATIQFRLILRNAMHRHTCGTYLVARQTLAERKSRPNFMVWSQPRI